MSDKIRCPWPDIPIYLDYHDNEWGRPVHDDRKLFEFLILEGMQVGLSWITVLKKREAFGRPSTALIHESSPFMTTRKLGSSWQTRASSGIAGKSTRL